MLNRRGHISVGNEKLDEQHRMFIEKVAECEQIGEGRLPLSQLEELLQFLSDYAVHHFTDEEAYMASYGYPELDRHQEEHVTFVKRLADLLVELHEKKESVELARKAGKYMNRWLSHHIKSMDLKYVEYIEKVKK